MRERSKMVGKNMNKHAETKKKELPGRGGKRWWPFDFDLNNY